MTNTLTVPDKPMDIGDYHALPNVGSSFLKAFIRSPLHAWSAYLDPEREPDDKLAYRVGRAWHCALFEPGEFERRYVADHTENKNTTRAQVLASVLAGEINFNLVVGIPDDIGKTTKAGKELYAEMKSHGCIPIAASEWSWIDAEFHRMQGYDVLSADKIAEVQKMASIARALPISRVLFDQLAERGRAEVSIMDVDVRTMLPIKIRPDYLVEPCAQFPNGLIVDGKSCQDASLEGFGRAVWNYDYGLQAAFYTSTMWSTYGTRGRPAFLWLAQEKARPYAGQYFAAGDPLLDYWDKRIADLLPRVAECMASGVWPGYPSTVEMLALPAWAEARMDGEGGGA